MSCMSQSNCRVTPCLIDANYLDQLDENDFTVDMSDNLSRDVLRDIGITKVGDQVKIMKAVDALKQPQQRK
jgi:hypothetical protein